VGYNGKYHTDIVVLSQHYIIIYISLDNNIYIICIYNIDNIIVIYIYTCYIHIIPAVLFSWVISYQWISWYIRLTFRPFRDHLSGLDPRCVEPALLGRELYHQSGRAGDAWLDLVRKTEWKKGVVNMEDC
jgi:hypothetical protein